MPAPLERFAFGVFFTVMLPCPIRRFRNRCVGFAIGTEAAVEFDLRLKGFVRFTEVMPAGSDGQSGADYSGFLQDGVQFSAHIIGVLGNGLPVAGGRGVLIVSIVSA